MESEIGDESRPRGFLTEADRRYLLGTSDLEPRSHGERRARERIRNRFFNALLDFVLVEEHLADRDREQVFEKLISDDDDYTIPGPQADGVQALQAIATLAFEGALRREIPFETLATHGVGEAMRRRVDEHLMVTVGANISVEVEQPAARKMQLGEIKQKVEDGFGFNDLDTGEKANLFNELYFSEDHDPVAEGIEAGEARFDQMLEAAKEQQDSSETDGE